MNRGGDAEWARGGLPRRPPTAPGGSGVAAAEAGRAKWRNRLGVGGERKVKRVRTVRSGRSGFIFRGLLKGYVKVWVRERPRGRRAAHLYELTKASSRAQGSRIAR